MSLGSRIAIGIVCGLSALGFLVLPMAMPPDARSIGAYVPSIFMTICVIACIGGRAGAIARRIVAAGIFLFCIGYIIAEIRQPLPSIQTYSRSNPNIVNAIICFCIFGLPAGYYVVRGFLPHTERPPDKTLVLSFISQEFVDSKQDEVTTELYDATLRQKIIDYLTKHGYEIITHPDDDKDDPIIVFNCDGESYSLALFYLAKKPSQWLVGLTHIAPPENQMLPNASTRTIVEDALNSIPGVSNIEWDAEGDPKH